MKTPIFGEYAFPTSYLTVPKLFEHPIYLFFHNLNMYFTDDGIQQLTESEPIVEKVTDIIPRGLALLQCNRVARLTLSPVMTEAAIVHCPGKCRPAHRVRWLVSKRARQWGPRRQRGLSKLFSFLTSDVG